MTELPEPTLDPTTLREAYPSGDAVRQRIGELRTEIRDAPDETGELLARGDLVSLLRIAGETDEALNEATAAADRAEMAGTAAQQHLARLRLAQVHQARGEFAESNPLFTELLASGDQFGPVIEAFTHHDAGVNDFDQGHWADARSRFAHALQLRADLELDETAASRTALAAAERRAEEDS